MKKAVKWTIGVIIIIMIGAYVVYEMIKPVEVELLNVQSGEVVLSFKEEGKVEPVLKRDIYTILTQKIVELNIEEGQFVEEGSIIACLDNEAIEKQINILEVQRDNMIQLKNMTLKELKNQIEQQQLMVQETARQIDTSKKELERIKSLFENNSASSVEVETVENQVNLLEGTLEKQNLALLQMQTQYNNPKSETVGYHSSNVDTVASQIRQLESQLKDSIIKAPISGIIVDLNYRKGGIISPQLPLCTLYQPDDYRIEVMVLSEDAVNLKKGMIVDLTQKLSGGDIQFTGEIGYIAPAATESLSSLGLKEQRVKMHIKLVEQKGAVLSPGFSVDVEFTTFREDNLITVPKTSLFKSDGKDTLWIVEDGKAVMRYVEKGISTDVDTVITEGIVEGEYIIKNPNIDGLSVGKSVVEIK
ncbi:HlyD family efflux transporter periplasmic adaptor subunit [Herbivorax sp. ANBcel31]|uniref:efflux RND transporter periplasmic adaptor subunit n=1 Tax=Herbivorax sp. ANBcel31 TaxID=3069754 RepID=UPI0027B475FD|nr:HlyD family efflux transporter periplasmic adaptor subunit [Herbivorax sp. ANBcel31]MDQ2086239.1 HlyD family efflux transporter periplasmic adaptor subunit [Herbivorax sp. ANBcel31]